MRPQPVPSTDPTLEEAHRFFDALEHLVRGDGDLATLLCIPPELVQLVAEHGDRLLTNGRFSEAREVFTTCLALTPGNWTLAHRAGLACRALGDEDLATECLDTAAQMKALGEGAENRLPS